MLSWQVFCFPVSDFKSLGLLLREASRISLMTPLGLQRSGLGPLEKVQGNWGAGRKPRGPRFNRRPAPGLCSGREGCLGSAGGGQRWDPGGAGQGRARVGEGRGVEARVESHLHPGGVSGSGRWASSGGPSRPRSSFGTRPGTGAAVPRLQPREGRPRPPRRQPPRA